MTTIIAQGEKYGYTFTITIKGPDKGRYKNIKVEPFDDIIEDELKRELAEGHRIANYTPGEKTLLNAYNVLLDHFFDKKPDIIVRGDVGTIPYSKAFEDAGGVY